MFELEIRQEYSRITFVFDDMEEVSNMIEIVKSNASVETTITMTCKFDPKGEEDDND